MIRFILSAIILATPATAETCAPFINIRDSLLSKYGETRLFAGVTATSSLIVTFGNEDSSTWTVLMVKPDGIACFLASGEGFVLPDDPNGEGA